MVDEELLAELRRELTTELASDFENLRAELASLRAHVEKSEHDMGQRVDELETFNREQIEALATDVQALNRLLREAAERAMQVDLRLAAVASWTIAKAKGDIARLGGDDEPL